MTRRNWTADEKLAVVLEGISGRKAIADICRDHQISQSQFYKWRDLFLAGAKQALAGRAAAKDPEQLDIERLQRLIGKQTVQIEILRKRRSCSGSGNRGEPTGDARLFRQCRLPSTESRP
jgi:transposase-like protein